jgi:hypothetical protein
MEMETYLALIGISESMRIMCQSSPLVSPLIYDWPATPEFPSFTGEIVGIFV